jgi:hypothetical protein
MAAHGCRRKGQKIEKDLTSAACYLPIWGIFEKSRLFTVPVNIDNGQNFIRAVEKMLRSGAYTRSRLRDLRQKSYAA